MHANVQAQRDADLPLPIAAVGVCRPWLMACSSAEAAQAADQGRLRGVDGVWSFVSSRAVAGIEGASP
jgi:hypothetical protein